MLKQSTTTRRNMPRAMMGAAGALVASLALLGCSRTDPQDTKNAVGDTATAIEQKAKEIGSEAAAGLDKAKDAAASATAKASEKIDDAVITSSVKAEIAKDSKLSALSINVDTDNGKVALKGTAPDAAALEQATTLAQNVKGVVSVDNQLTVKAQ